MSLRHSLVLLLVIAQTASAALIKEEGATYLDDLIDRPVRLAVVQDAPIFFDITLERYLGILKKPQVVELQAIAGNLYRVRGRAVQGGVLGWVDKRYLSPLDEKFLASIKKTAQRQAEINALIARNEVGINMRPDEVIASLGKPAKKSSRLDATGRHETWEYIRYERVPQQVTGYDSAGRLISSTTYMKVPAGRLSVIFDDNLVSALEQTEGTLLRGDRVKIVAPPLIPFGR